MVNRNTIPILEHDEETRAVIMPKKRSEKQYPRKAVFPFLDEKVDDFAAENSWELIDHYETITKIFPIYKGSYKGEELCLCQAPLGGPASVGILEHMIANGVEIVLAAGSCGTLEDLEENAFIIPIRALRDEGTSYHYLTPERYVNLDRPAIEALEKTLKERNLPYRLADTWTTDAFFRETEAMVAYRKQEGCAVVEMECASLAACARFRGIQFGQLLFTADSLADAAKHQERNWGEDSHYISLELIMEALLYIY